MSEGYVNAVDSEFLWQYTGVRFTKDKDGNYTGERDGMVFHVCTFPLDSLFVWGEYRGDGDRDKMRGEVRKLRDNLLLAVEERVRIPGLYRWKRVAGHSCRLERLA